MKPGPPPWVPITATALLAGYGMAGDLRSLGASCPALAQAQKQLRGSLDLLQVHKQVSAGGCLGGDLTTAGGVSVRQDLLTASLCSPSWPWPCSLATGHQGPRAQGPQASPGPWAPLRGTLSTLSTLGVEMSAPEPAIGQVTVAPRHLMRPAWPSVSRVPGAARRGGHRTVPSTALTPGSCCLGSYGWWTRQPQVWMVPRGLGASASWCSRCWASPWTRRSSSPTGTGARWARSSWSMQVGTHTHTPPPVPPHPPHWKLKPVLPVPGVLSVVQRVNDPACL